MGDSCAIAVRMSADGHGDMHLSADEAHDLIAMLDPFPDLWDIVISDYNEEMGSSRFMREASLENRVAYVKSLTGKPVVTVGRFTSPDTMLSQVKRGITDFIGAARPSIADPFLPAKIRDGQIEDIRECIGCNICYAHNTRAAPLRCTQNPTMGEEWRRGWHPERITRDSTGSILIVGAGPAGLEAAHILGKRGFAVSIADADSEAGGRVTRESRLPGLAEWARVRDYRLGQISKLPQVSLHLGSRMSAADVRDFDADHIVIATGSAWRRDGTGRWHDTTIAEFNHDAVFTPDDILDGHVPSGRVVLFDDDHYYMAPVIAELLVRAGANVTYVTTEGKAGSWSYYTQEQQATQRRLIELGVDIQVSTAVMGFDGKSASLACVYTARQRFVGADALVLVTSREPHVVLYESLLECGLDAWRIRRIGDCYQPSIIAAAIYAGHKVGRELGTGQQSQIPRDRPVIA